jgi:hypothetical protein
MRRSDLLRFHSTPNALQFTAAQAKTLSSQRAAARVWEAFAQTGSTEAGEQAVRIFEPPQKTPLARNLIVARHSPKLRFAAYAKEALSIKSFCINSGFHDWKCSRRVLVGNIEEVDDV